MAKWQNNYQYFINMGTPRVEVGPLMLTMDISELTISRNTVFRMRAWQPFRFVNDDKPYDEGEFFYTQKYNGEQYVQIIKASPYKNTLGLPVFKTSPDANGLMASNLTLVEPIRSDSKFGGDSDRIHDVPTDKEFVAGTANGIFDAVVPSSGGGVTPSGSDSGNQPGDVKGGDPFSVSPSTGEDEASRTGNTGLPNAPDAELNGRIGNNFLVNKPGLITAPAWLATILSPLAALLSWIINDVLNIGAWKNLIVGWVIMFLALIIGVRYIKNKNKKEGVEVSNSSNNLQNRDGGSSSRETNKLKDGFTNFYRRITGEEAELRAI